MNNKDTVQDPSHPSFSLITKGSVLCRSICSLGLEDYKRSPPPTKQTKSNSMATVTGEVPASVHASDMCSEAEGQLSSKWWTSTNCCVHTCPAAQMQRNMCLMCG